MRRSTAVRRRGPTSASAYRTITYAGSTVRRASRAIPLPLESDSAGTGLQSMPHRLRRQPHLLTRMLAPEVEHLAAVEAHLGAFVDGRRLAREREVGRELGPRRRARELRDVVDPPTACEHA